MNISRFLQASPNVMIFSYAPLWMSTRYLHLLGTLYYIINRKERTQIEKNIKEVFKGDRNVDSIVKKAFDGIINHYSEKLIMAYSDLAFLKKDIGKVIEYSGLHYLDDALKQGGVVLVTGHFGAVEFLPLALHLRNYPVSMVVSFQTEQLKNTLIKRAEEGNVELIDATGKDILLRSMNAVKQGRIFLTECDEVDMWNTKKGRTFHAFGSEIYIDRYVEILCKRTCAPVFGSFMVRTQDGYSLNIVPVRNCDNIPEGGLAEEIFKTLEKFVMMFPEQWYQWKKFHKMRVGA